MKQATENSELMFDELWVLGKAITSHALASNLSWPLVTIPHFDVRASSNESRLDFAGFAPFVTSDMKQEWEDYSVANQEWIAEAYHYRGWDDVSYDPIPGAIHKYEESGKDPWFAVSLFAELTPNPFNYSFYRASNCLTSGTEGIAELF